MADEEDLLDETVSFADEPFQKYLNKLRIHTFYPLIPLLYFFPKISFTIGIAAAAFVLGILYKESLLNGKNSVSNVEKHFERRILSKPSPPTLTATNEANLSEELNGALHKLIGFIVRDFINSWYDNFNVSKSKDFSTAIHNSLLEVFKTLGSHASEINPTDLMLAVTRQAIVHVREFRDFDLTGLDMQDFIKLNPSSKFTRYNSRIQIIESLREIAMKLCIKLLPRADRNSPAVFAITQEILATTVFLPLIDKITNPDWLNNMLLNALRQKQEESLLDPPEIQEEETNDREIIVNVLQGLSSLILKTKGRIGELDESLAQGSTADVESLLKEKLRLQSQLEEVLELQSREQESPTRERLLDIRQVRIDVKFLESNPSEQNILTGIVSSTFQHIFELSITNRLNHQWKITKNIKEIEKLEWMLANSIPRSATMYPCPGFVKELCSTNIFGSFGEKRITTEEYLSHSEELTEWLNRIARDPLISLFVPFIGFFQPKTFTSNDPNHSISNSFAGIWKSASNSDLGASLWRSASSVELGSSLQKALNTTGIMKVSASEPALPEQKESFTTEKVEDSISRSSNISQEDIDIILDVVFSAIEELFSLNDEDQWLRQQSLNLVKAILKRTYASKLSIMIASKVDAVSSQPTATKTLNSLSDTLWPDGRKWGQGPQPEVRTPFDSERTKNQLHSVLTGKAGFKKSPEFESVFANIKTAVGSQNAQKGLLRGFQLVQNQQLNAGLCCEILETLTMMVCDV